MSYSIRRTDTNQKEIVECFRKLGVKVLILSSVGNGCPDILVGITLSDGSQRLRLIEIKDGKKPPSGRKLTLHEERFHHEWDGFVSIVSSVDEAVDLVNKASYF